MKRIITTKYGQIRGLEKSSKFNGDLYYSFQGIPFAKPPLGSLRFKSPVPIEPWNGILEAVSEKCIPHYKKSHFDSPAAHEDCLYLNVYAKNLNMDKKPVIVFVYGGGFHSGSAATNLYGPDFLMTQEVILVTFNYRLGPLGFMSLNNSDINVAGNAGLKDQRLALKWVKENIDAFGGDCENVTVVGQSAGACSLHHHLLSENSKGLFKRAVLLSGSASGCWGLCEAQHMGEKLAAALGWNGEGGERGAYEFLMLADAQKIAEAGTSELLLSMEDRMKDVMHSFGPKIEREYADAVVTKNPRDAIKTCWSKDLEVIFWYTSNEALYFFDASFYEIALAKGIPEMFLVPYEARKVMKDDEVEKAGNKLKNMYGSFVNNHKAVQDFFNDQIFLHGIHRGILSRVANCPSGKTYLARFNLDSDTLNHAKIRHLAKDQVGVAHADDCSYLFTNHFGPVPTKGSVEYENVEKMVKFLVNFASEGSQYCDKLSWKPINAKDLPHQYEALKIEGPEWKVGKVEEMSRFLVLDSVFLKGKL